MEVFDYFKEAQRMCISYPNCKGCPLVNSPCRLIRCIEGYSEAEMRCAIKVVEQWSKEHPIITNAKKFEEIFGVKPENAEVPYKGRSFPNWWDEPYKEPEHED